MNSKIILIIGLIFLSSCHKSEMEIESEFLNEALKPIDAIDNVNWVVILPGAGCQGCIQEGEFFMKEYVDNKNILFILTKIESLKILQNKLEINIDDYPNIYVDSKESFSVPTDNRIYPCIAKIKDGEVEMHGFQSPNESQAFVKLKSEIVKPM